MRHAFMTMILERNSSHSIGSCFTLQKKYGKRVSAKSANKIDQTFIMKLHRLVRQYTWLCIVFSCKEKVLKNCLHLFENGIWCLHHDITPAHTFIFFHKFCLKIQHSHYTKYEVIYFLLFTVSK